MKFLTCREPDFCSALASPQPQAFSAAYHCHIQTAKGNVLVNFAASLLLIIPKRCLGQRFHLDLCGGGRNIAEFKVQHWLLLLGNEETEYPF